MGNIGALLCSNCNQTPGTPTSDMEADRRLGKNCNKSKKKKKDVQSLALKMAVSDIRSKFGINNQLI